MTYVCVCLCYWATLDIIVERTVLVAVLAQQTESINICKILKLYQTVHSIPASRRYWGYQNVCLWNKGDNTNCQETSNTVRERAASCFQRQSVLRGAFSRCTTQLRGDKPKRGDADLRVHRVFWKCTAILKCCFCYKSCQRWKLKELFTLFGFTRIWQADTCCSSFTTAFHNEAQRARLNKVSPIWRRRTPSPPSLPVNHQHSVLQDTIQTTYYTEPRRQHRSICQ